MSKTPAKTRITHFLAENGALVGLVTLCIALFIATPTFLTTKNLLNVGIQSATTAILAFGMTFVIVTAGIDLAVGSIAALGAMVCATMFTNVGLPGWLTLLIGLLIGAKIFRRINPELLRHIIYGFMAFSGLVAVFS